MSAISSEQSLKAALIASQTWWNDMGIDVPSVPSLQKKSTQKTNNNDKKDPRIQRSTLAPVPTPLEISEQMAKAAEQAKAAPTLDALKTIMQNFDAGVLSDHARNMVFARGNPDADIMVIGEAPGRQEDEQGLPFVGPAGELLDKMFAAIDLNADGLYITNVCNWRPPDNRDPSAEELAICAPFIARHMELVAPKMVIIVGAISLLALTGKPGIMKTRGQWQKMIINGEPIPTMPIYHPVFLIRRPELKKDTWRDLLAIKERLEAK